MKSQQGLVHHFSRYCGYPPDVPNRILRTFNALPETRRQEEPVGWGATHATAGGMIGAAKV